MESFCPKCGKTGKLIEGLCKDCFSEKVSIKLTHDRFLVCNECGKSGVFENIKEAIRSRIKSDWKIKKMDFSIKEGSITVDAKIQSGRNVFDKSFEIPVFIQKALCRECSNLHGGYYESIVQLRDRDSYDDLIAKARSARLEEKKEGVDLYFTHRDDAIAFVALLAKKFDAKPKETRSLVGQKDGKRIYRNTILVRLAPKKDVRSRKNVEDVLQ